VSDPPAEGTEGRRARLTRVEGLLHDRHERTVVAAMEALKSLDGEVANVMVLIGFEDDQPLVYFSPGRHGLLGLLGLLRAAEHVSLTTEAEGLPEKEGS